MSTGVPSEFEAKLLAPGEGTLRAVARLRELGPYKLVLRDTVRLQSLYLDTADLTLARQRIALRLRRSRRRWEATIKWEGTCKAELHDRPELNIPLRGQPRLPFEVKHPQLQEHLAARVAGRPLQIIVVTSIRRTRLHVLRHDQHDNETALAEICLDRVHLHGEQTGGAETRYCEIEVEQLDGDRDVVRQVASQLRHAFNLLPSTESKFSRGLALLGHRELLGTPHGGLVVEDTIESAAHKIIWEQLSRLREHDPGSRRGDDLEALHDMRVATRRLRAALATFRAAFPQKLWIYLRDELKWLRQTLGSVRDMDVQLERVNAFGGSTPAALRVSLQTYARFLERRRAEHRKELLAALSSARYFALLVRLEEYATGGGAMHRLGALQSVGRLAAEEIDKAYRRVCKRGRKVEAEPRPEDLHGLRIRAKRLRYTLELCRDLTGREGGKAICRLVRLQDLLGNFHDAVVAADFVRQYVEGPGKRAGSTALITMGAFLGSELHRADTMRSDFARTWKRFERRRTRREIDAIVRRLHKNEPCSAPTPPDSPDPAPDDNATLEGLSTTSRANTTTEAPVVDSSGDAVESEERRPPAKHGGAGGPEDAAVAVAGGTRRR